MERTALWSHLVVKECEDRNQTIDNFPKLKTMRFYFLFGIACLSLLWEVSSQWSPRASDSEFYRALGPVSSFLAQRKARNGLWLWPKTRNWVCNRWLRPRQRTARTYQRLQTISSSIFSGLKPEKMLSRAYARDKEEEIPERPGHRPNLHDANRDLRPEAKSLVSWRLSFGPKEMNIESKQRTWIQCLIPWDPKRTRLQARKKKTFVPSYARARFLLLLFGWFGHTLALESQSMLGSSDQTPGPR